MWEQLSSDDAAWDDALEKEGKAYSKSVVTASANALCAAKKFHEIFIGGDNTACLVQLLSAADEDGVQSDFMASVLLPEEDVQICYSARGEKATQLVASFWNWSPQSPALVQHNEKYHHIMCSLPIGSWTVGPLSPDHIQKLQKSDSVDVDNAQLQIYVPGEEVVDISEKKRAAICRN